MEIRSYLCYILLNCFLMFPSLSSKSVSLNDLIAAEDRSASLQKPQLKFSEIKSNVKESPNNYKIYTLSKHMSSGSIALKDQKTSPLKYKKTYQIRTPLRPKKIKYSLKPRSRRINTTTKREIDNYEDFNRNYIPLLKSLSVLFNNILRSDSGEDNDPEYYDKQHNSDNISKSECACAKSKHGTTDRESAKKTAPITTSITSTVPTKAKTDVPSETSSSPAYNTLNDNIGPIRRNKNVPILSARDSIGSRRNNNGFGEGSFPAYYRNSEGHIARNNGNDENNSSGRETTETNTENYKQYTNSSTGDDAGCNGDCGTIGRTGLITSNSGETSTVETIIGANKTVTNDRGDSNQFKGFNQLETGRNKAESRILLSESSSRLRRFESQEETTEILWQIENSKKGDLDVTYNITRNRRFPNRDGSVAPKDQELRRANKKLMLDDLTTFITASPSNLPQDKQKFVVIYDGYSIARDVNGKNKLSEKAYRIHS